MRMDAFKMTREYEAIIQQLEYRIRDLEAENLELLRELEYLKDQS